jgi:hypothetical protein
MRTRFSLSIFLVCYSSLLAAQPESRERYQGYGGYTFLSNSMNGVPGSRQPLNGFDGSIAFPSWHNLSFKIDAFAYMGTNLNAPQHVYFILGGGQYGRRFGREYAYFEGLAGDGGINKNWGANATTGETASFSTLLGGGLDSRLTRRLAFRVSGGYQWSNFALAPPTLPNIPYRIPGLPNNFGRISTGLVWRF